MDVMKKFVKYKEKSFGGRKAISFNIYFREILLLNYVYVVWLSIRYKKGVNTTLTTVKQLFGEIKIRGYTPPLFSC